MSNKIGAYLFSSICMYKSCTTLIIKCFILFSSVFCSAHTYHDVLVCVCCVQERFRAWSQGSEVCVTDSARLCSDSYSSSSMWSWAPWSRTPSRRTPKRSDGQKSLRIKCVFLCRSAQRVSSVFQKRVIPGPPFLFGACTVLLALLVAVFIPAQHAPAVKTCNTRVMMESVSGVTENGSVPVSDEDHEPLLQDSSLWAQQETPPVWVLFQQCCLTKLFIERLNVCIFF